MAITKIISSGTLGAESAALDVAIRFNIAYGGYTNQGSLIAGDRPPGRYTLDEKPFVNPALLLKANRDRADGVLVFSNGPMPHRLTPILPDRDTQAPPCLHIDFTVVKPHPAAFRIGTWVSTNALTSLFITGPDIQEDRGIYQQVHDALISFFMLDQESPMPHAGHTIH
ncbi:MAG: hypothetical protein HF981_09370 [Desulfobacteraceae bacterium]|nr:hypothetical protein [Desulfobacteraceae bacterium]MBC2750581.1 hypothetical protein [Desulfobacteraceae bacterium]